MSQDETTQPNPELIFQKFKQYFDNKFRAIETPKQDSPSVRELKNKLEAKDLTRPGNVAQFEFCGRLEIAIDSIKAAVLVKQDSDAAIEAIHTAEQLISDRKRKIKIADASKAGWSTIAHLDKADHLTSEQQKSVKAAEEEALKELDLRKRRKRDNQHGASGPDPTDRYLFRGTCIFSTSLPL